MSVKAILEFFQRYDIQGTDDEHLKLLIDVCLQKYELTAERLEFILTDLANREDLVQIDIADVLEAVINELLRTKDLKKVIEFYYDQYVHSQVGVEYQEALKRGDFRRAQRITAAIEQLQTEVPPSDDYRITSLEGGYPSLKHDHALVLAELGELEQAEIKLRELVSELDFQDYTFVYLGIAAENLCDVLTLRGKLYEAECLADKLIQAYEFDHYISLEEKEIWLRGRRVDYLGVCDSNVGNLTSGSNPYARRAVARVLRGKVSEALSDFKRAESFQKRKLSPLHQLNFALAAIRREKILGDPVPKDIFDQTFEPPPLTGQAAIFYALLLTRLGKLESARKILDYSKQWASHQDNYWPSMIAYAEVALSDVYRLMGHYEQARQMLDYPIEWASKTGQQEIYCWAKLANARLNLLQNQLIEAWWLVNEAYQVTTEHGFKLYEIDCNITAGQIALRQGQLQVAQTKAYLAFEAASHSDCTYAWGRGNALHLLGEVLVKQGDFEKARSILEDAAQLREQIEDPHSLNTRELLAKIKMQSEGNS